MNPLIYKLFQQKMPVRIVAFGSSNTERAGHSGGCYNWFDWLDICLHKKYGRVHHCINAGIGGNTTDDLLSRFDRDVAWYRPDIVFVTVGANDALFDFGISEIEYRKNLIEIVRKIMAMDGCLPILQTYYSINVIAATPECEPRVHDFSRYMQIVRDVAAEEQIFKLIED